MITLHGMMCLYCIVWIASTLVEGVSSFVPLAPTHLGASSSTLFLFPEWMKVKKSVAEPARITVSENDDKPPTNAYASRLTLSKDKVDDAIDIKLVTDPTPAARSFAKDTDYDVVVVGAGCAGIGTALMLTKTFGLDTSRVLCVEQGKKVGTSFRQWPEEMRFISPSFNQQGWTKSFDLNSIYWGTSPADLLRSEHPSGDEYAIYLEAIVEQSGLQVQLQTKVASITDVGGADEPGPFNVEMVRSSGSTSKRETITSRYVVWAAGEFQFPREKRTMEYVYKNGEDLPEMRFNSMFKGSEYCLHSSRVRSWKKLAMDTKDDEIVIIGGYESGIDAAFNLAKAGKRCKVLASTPTWCVKTGDPSSELAPYTAARLREVLSNGFSPNPQLLAPLKVIAVDKGKEGVFNIAAQWSANDIAQDAKGLGFKIDEPGEDGSIIVLQTKQPPILCTGFEGSVAVEASNLFNFPDPLDVKNKGCISDGPLLTLDDESTKVPGIFLAGPSVSHGDLSFCFVYKFRQRFAVVANAICQGLGRDTKEIVAECRLVDMYLDNFEPCNCDEAC